MTEFSLYLSYVILYSGALNDRMHVLNKLEGIPDETNNLNGSQDKQEAAISTDIDAFGRLYRTVLLSHGHVISLSILIKKGVFKKICNGLSNKPLMQKVSFTDLFYL